MHIHLINMSSFDLKQFVVNCKICHLNVINCKICCLNSTCKHSYKSQREEIVVFSVYLELQTSFYLFYSSIWFPFAFVFPVFARLRLGSWVDMFMSGHLMFPDGALQLYYVLFNSRLKCLKVRVVYPGVCLSY